MGEGHHMGSTNDLDVKRQETTAYEYLCHLEEARKWIADCTKEDVPPVTEFEENLRNGVLLAKLGTFCAPNLEHQIKIFDVDQTRWREHGLHFKHTDNINHFLRAVRVIGLPETFLPETTDIYDRKNMPRAIFCLHALSLYMFKLGNAPKMEDLYGRAQFTDFEISKVQEELDKTGVELPKFKHLGGMLGADCSGDRRMMEVVFQDVSEMVNQKNLEGLYAALTSPAARLRDVLYANMRQYMLVLTAESRNLTRPLSQPEVQGLISRVNLLVCLEDVLSAVKQENELSVLAALKASPLGVNHLVYDRNSDLYLTNLLDAVQELSEDDILKKDTILSAVVSANELEKEKDSMEYLVGQVNAALKGNDLDKLLATLNAINLPHVLPQAAHLYHTELTYVQRESGADLTYDGISSTVEFLNLVAKVSIAAIDSDNDELYRCLCEPQLQILDMDPEARLQYCQQILKLVEQNQRALSHSELQDAVDHVNSRFSEDLRRIKYVEDVNLCLQEGGHTGLSDALRGLGFHLEARDVPRCLQELRSIQANKSQREGFNVEVWLEDITEAVEVTKESVEEALKVAGVLRGLNSAVDYNDEIGLMSYIGHYWNLLGMPVRPDRSLGSHLLQKLKDLRRPDDHNWVPHILTDGSSVFIEVASGEIAWTKPSIMSKTNGGRMVGLHDILEALQEISQFGPNSKINKLMPRFQAHCRGYLVRKKLFDTLEWYYRNEASVIRVQALWRGKMARRQMVVRLQEEIKKRQSALNWMSGYGDLKRLERSALVVQRAWREKRLRQQWQKIVDSGSADLHTVVAHMHLLDIRGQDAREELELARARGELSKLLRNIDSLEQELEEMDKKIGLLVQNRISVQDVVEHKKKGGLTMSRGTLHKKSESTSGSQIGTHRGLKALKKESHDRLKGYQHLFYLLQTDPDYIARLMFAVPQPNPKFMETLIFTLYNFGGNQREEILLIRLFRTALRREIATKVVDLYDVVKNTPLVLKLVVGHNRNWKGGYQLRQLLAPLIKQVLEDNTLNIITNPVEVYKLWINQLESETGQPAGLPYNVTQAEAMNYEEVQKRFAKSISSLKRITTLFLATITGSVRKLPYGILYTAKVLYYALKEKFPDAAEKEILKVVGNLVYYKYINPVIISPDRYDMMDNVRQGGLKDGQRRNLSHVAKLLQFAATNKGFDSAAPHLQTFNSYLRESHEKLKHFFFECTQVVEPEEEFSIDRYTEAALIAKPVIYIKLSEICDTHQLLMDHEQTVAPASVDPLHALLASLGPPSLSSLLGAADTDCSSLQSLGQTEVCLVLGLPPGTEMRKDLSDTDRLWIKTKHLLLAILPAVHYSDKQTLIGVLKSRTTDEQERIYNSILDKREEGDRASRMNKDIEVNNIFSDEEGRLPLEDAKRLVLKNLRILEVARYTSSKDNCQSIISDIARDILNLKEHRINRRRELTKMKRSKAELMRKQDYITSQLDQYRQYVDHCLTSMNRAGSKRNRRVHFSTLEDGEQERKVRSKASIKYSATKLYEKGVLLTIEGLPPAQLKNVLFVFMPMEASGMFEISARFMGVDMERVVIDIQDLLKLQYDGVAVTDMFRAVKINVNLLLHFLNAKFYGK